MYYRNYGPIHDAIVRLIPDGSRMLNIGCGLGLLCRKIKQRLPAIRVLGVDFAEDVIARNRERDRALSVEYCVADVRTAFACIGGSFHMPTIFEVVEHLKEPEHVVAAAMRLLNPGGRFVLTCRHDNLFSDPENLRIWSNDALFHLLELYGDTVCFTIFLPPYCNFRMMTSLTKNALPPSTEEAQ